VEPGEVIQYLVMHNNTDDNSRGERKILSPEDIDNIILYSTNEVINNA
jgi:hypothetical protein